MVIAAACSFDWDAFDPRQHVETTATAGGGGSSDGGAGAAGGFGGVGGQPGGAGGQPPTTLVDRGLVTRYFLDEAASGMTPSEVQDSAPDPRALTLDYGDISPPPPMGGMGGIGGAGGAPAGSGGSGPNVSWVENMGQRGMRFLVKNRSGGASSSITSIPKLAAMDGLTEATIECVAEVDGVGGSNVCNRLFHFGVNNNGQLSLCALSAGLSFRFNGEERETWDVDYDSAGRLVAHVVLDTARPDAERVLLYVNGVDQGAGAIFDEPPASLEAIALNGGRHVLGNRNGNDGTIEGVLYYCALYSVALTAAEVTNNATRLMANDDTL
jgi:hypothetical protein